MNCLHGWQGHARSETRIDIDSPQLCSRRRSQLRERLDRRAHTHQVPVPIHVVHAPDTWLLPSYDPMKQRLGPTEGSVGLSVNAATL